MLRFHYLSGSPIAWTVWLALERKQVPYELVTMSLAAGDLKKPEFLAKFPRGEVPAIDDDGFALHQASAIVEYLDERWPSAPHLFPRDVHDRATCRRLIREMDDYWVPYQFRLADELFFKPKPEDWNLGEICAMRDKLAAEMPHYERELRGDHLLGAEPTAADFTLYPMLAVWPRFEKKKPDLGLVAAIGPKIRAWMKRIEALPYFDKTYPPHWRT